MIIEIIEGVLLLASLYANRNLLKKNEALEDNADELVDHALLLGNHIVDVREAVKYTLEQMRAIDNRQIFEKDDEVGTTFAALLSTLEDLNTLIDDNADTDTKQETPKKTIS